MVSQHLSYNRILTLKTSKIATSDCGYRRAPRDLVNCRRQAYHNIVSWYLDRDRYYEVSPTGTVFHPIKQSLLSTLSFPLVWGEPVIVTDRFVHIFVPRRNQKWTEHWIRSKNRRAPKLRKATIDTDRQRCVVGDSIIAPRGRVIYEAGPEVDYRALVQAHITPVAEGIVNPFGDLRVPVSPSPNPEPSVEE